LQPNYKAPAKKVEGKETNRKRSRSEEWVEDETKRGIFLNFITCKFIFYLVLGEDATDDEEEVEPKKKKTKKNKFIDDEAEEN
jgi:hypothetical protein